MLMCSDFLSLYSLLSSQGSEAISKLKLEQYWTTYFWKLELLATLHLIKEFLFWKFCARFVKILNPSLISSWTMIVTIHLPTFMRIPFSCLTRLLKEGKLFWKILELSSPRHVMEGWISSSQEMQMKRVAVQSLVHILNSILKWLQRDEVICCDWK